MNVLGIETSCDETSAAVVEEGYRVLSNVVASQADLHARWGGVVPEVASRKHVERILPVIHEALDGANLDWSGVDGIAVTNRPGLVGALLVGVSAAKALAFALKKPIVAVHHLEGHLYSSFLTAPDLCYPFLALIVSGGHTELVAVHGPGILQSIGRTRDDAAGECFDKCARLMGLPYPGGPNVDKLASGGNLERVQFPRAWLRGTFDFSFSGLKTAVMRFMEADHGATPLGDIAASLQAAIIDVLVVKTIDAARETGIQTVCVVGGVAANRGLGWAMERACRESGFRLVIPQPGFCTDNAAMIAAAAYSRLASGQSDSLSFDTFATDFLVSNPENPKSK